MKFSRPAASAAAATTAAAVALAVAAVPGVHTASDEQPQALATQVAPVRPANLETEAVVPAVPAEEPEKVTSATAPSTEAAPAVGAPVAGAGVEGGASASESPEGVDPVGGSVPDGDEAGLANAVEELLGPDAEGAEADNMPAVAGENLAGSTATPEKVSELTAAPVNYKGNPQAWFHNIGLIKGGKAYQVYSDSMGRNIPVAVIRATNPDGTLLTGAPTYYLLNGAGGSEQDTDWLTQAFEQVRDTFQDEPVNVVIPMEGAFSYYVDWLSDPQPNTYLHGKQKWSTFLGSELPNSIEPFLNANGTRAVSGFSMSATSALLLAEHNPDQYAAVGSFSGCAATSTALPSFFVGLTVNRGSAGRGNLSPADLWGARGSEYNRYNDALVMAEKLRGTQTKLYISAGTGLPSNTDMIGELKKAKELTSSEALAQALTLQVEGGAIEAAMNACTHDLHTKLKALDVPVTFNKRATGTHSWPVWHDDLKVSWERVIGPALLPGKFQQ